MPPQLALLLCAGFVVYLLRLERKESAGVSSACWIPTLWMMACASKSLALWFSFNAGIEGNTDAEAGSPWDRALNLFLIVAGLVVVKRRKVNWETLARDNAWLLAIHLYALVSIGWSDFTFISVKRYVRFLGTILMAGVILSESNPRQALESIIRRMAFVLVPFSLLLIKYYPQMGVMYGQWSGELMWVGVAYQKNSLGILCFVSAFFLAWRLLRRWREPGLQVETTFPYGDVLVAGMALYLLKGPGTIYSASATSISVFALGLGVLLGLLWARQRQIQVGLPVVAIFAALLFLYGATTPFGARALGGSILELLGRNATFTDRDQIWAELIPIAMTAPLLGLGFGGFWVLPIKNGVTSPHNGYLGIMLELGIVGILLMFGFVLSMCKASHRCLSRDFWWGSLGICLLLMVVLHNTSEASFVRTSDVLWSLLVFVRMTLPLDCATYSLTSAESTSAETDTDFAQSGVSVPGAGLAPIR